MSAAPVALGLLRKIGPVFRSKDAVAAGVSWRDLYALRDRSEILLQPKLAQAGRHDVSPHGRYDKKA
jgi:hypothetical protein